MLPRRAFFPILIFCVFSSLASAQTETALTLSDAIRLARDRGAESMMSHERVRQSVARTWQAYAAFLPQISAEASQVRQTRNLAASGISIPGSPEGVTGPFNTFDARLKLTQIVFDAAAFERLLAVRAGEKTVRTQNKKLEEDAMAFAAGLYLDAERARQSVVLAEAARARAFKRLAIAHRALRSGDAPALEVRESKALFKESLAAKKGMQIASRERLADLAVALGFGVKEPIRLEAGKDARAFGVPEAAAFDASSHPDLQAAQNLAEQRRVEEKIHWAEYFPKLMFMADYGAAGEEPAENTEETYSLGAKASMPVFEGGQRALRISEAQSRSREAAIAAEDTRRRLETGARDALDGLLAAKQMLDAKTSVQAAAERKRKYSQVCYENGSGSEWDYLESVFAEALASDEKGQAASDYLKAHVRLAHALGQVEKLITPQGPVSS